MNLFKNIFYVHSVFPFRIIVLKPIAIAYPPHMISNTTFLFIRPVHFVSRNFFAIIDRFKNRAIAKASTAYIVFPSSRHQKLHVLFLQQGLLRYMRELIRKVSNSCLHKKILLYIFKWGHRKIKQE